MAQFGIGNDLIGTDPVALALESRGAGMPAPLLEQQSMASPTGPGIPTNPQPQGGAPATPDQMTQPPSQAGLSTLDPATLTPQGVANSQGIIPPTNPEAEMILKAMQERLKAITQMQESVFQPEQTSPLQPMGQ